MKEAQGDFVKWAPGMPRALDFVDCVEFIHGGGDDSNCGQDSGKQEQPAFAFGMISIR